MANVDMIPINKEQMKDFLVTADFSTSNGYSYTELVLFLQNYKVFYKVQYTEKTNLMRELGDSEKRNIQLIEKIKFLESKLDNQNKQISNYKKHLSKKLSLWERIIGRIKI